MQCRLLPDGWWAMPRYHCRYAMSSFMRRLVTSYAALSVSLFNVVFYQTAGDEPCRCSAQTGGFSPADRQPGWEAHLRTHRRRFEFSFLVLLFLNVLWPVTNFFVVVDNVKSWCTRSLKSGKIFKLWHRAWVRFMQS